MLLGKAVRCTKGVVEQWLAPRNGPRWQERPGAQGGMGERERRAGRSGVVRA